MAAPLMNERQRMQYLEQMGISMFVPRWVLPAARKSEHASLPVVTEDKASGASQQRMPEASTASAMERVESKPDTSTKTSDHSINSIIGELSAKTRMSALSQRQRGDGDDQGRTAALDGVQGETVAFSLSVWRVTDRCWVLDSRAAKEALPTQELLHNILRAKNWSLPEPKPEILQWPMFSGPDYSGGWRAAREMVKAFMQARLEQYPVEYLWVMGEQAFGAMSGDTADYAAGLGKPLRFEGIDLQALVLPSLTDMLKDPSLKRVTWHAIRDLPQ